MPPDQNHGLTFVKSAEYPSNLLHEGDVITYTLSVTNTGNLLLQDVNISDSLPGLSDLTCSQAMPAVLTPTATIDCVATYTIQFSDIENGTVVNSAQVSAESILGGIDESDQVTVPSPDGAAFTLDKSLTGQADLDDNELTSVGDILTFTIQLVNTGNVTLTEVTVADTLPGTEMQGCNVPHPAILSPGQILICTVTYVIVDKDGEVGSIYNVAVASVKTENNIVIEAEETAVVDNVNPGEYTAIRLNNSQTDGQRRQIATTLAATMLVAGGSAYLVRRHRLQKEDRS